MYDVRYTGLKLRRAGLQRLPLCVSVVRGSVAAAGSDVVIVNGVRSTRLHRDLYERQQQQLWQRHCDKLMKHNKLAIESRTSEQTIETDLCGRLTVKRFREPTYRLSPAQKQQQLK